MAKSKAQKEALLEQYKSLLTDKGGFIAVDTLGMDAVTITQLKKKLREHGTNIAIVKNSVFKIALNETNHPVESSDFTEQTAIIAYNEDPTIIAKLVKEVQTETEKFQARFGVVDGAFLDGSRVISLADIPSREVLLAKLLGSINAPVTGFASVITGNARGFVRAMQQLSEKGGAAA